MNSKNTRKTRKFVAKKIMQKITPKSPKKRKFSDKRIFFALFDVFRQKKNRKKKFMGTPVFLPSENKNRMDKGFREASPQRWGKSKSRSQEPHE